MVMIHPSDHPECMRERTVANLVDALFRQKRNPTNGRIYSYAEVSRALEGALQPSYLAKLRSGEIKNPGRDAILYLCRFFAVPAAYFFPELVTPASAERPAEALQRVLAALQLTTPHQVLVEALIVALQPPLDDAPPHEHARTEDVT